MMTDAITNDGCLTGADTRFFVDTSSRKLGFGDLSDLTGGLPHLRATKMGPQNMSPCMHGGLNELLLSD